MIVRVVPFLCFVFFLLPLQAHEEMPWFGQVFEFQFRTFARYQQCSTLSTPSGRVPFRSNDGFFAVSLQLSPWENIDTELELFINIHTRTRHLQWNGFSLTGRYLVLDDILGDPVSLSVGGTLIKGWRPARFDPAVFYPAQIGAEFHAAIGREIPCGATWKSRFWLYYALGFGDVRSLWNRVNLSFEKNFCDCSSIRIFANSLWGAGGKNLPSSPKKFKGYGPIHFQAVDLGLRYGYRLGFIGELSGEYAYRVHTRNFPFNAQTVTLCFHLPFGL